MKAVLLAAGKGERLKKITNEIPKPMIKIAGKPILQHNIELCNKFGIKEIFINTHHLSTIITNFFEDGSKFGVKIKYSYEEELLGTAGALNNFKDFLQEEDFFVIYGDNLSNFDLNLLISKKKKNNAIANIAFHYREDTSQSGVAEFGSDKRILKFIEKPKLGESNSHWVNAGIYLFDSEIIKYIPQGFSDFGKDIFPHLLELNIPMYGVCKKSEVLAFDTLEMYNKNINKF